MKRFFDIALSLTAIVILIPVFAPLIIILRLTGEGEVFYSQVRVGRYGREFGLFKFATMLKNSPNIGSGTVTVMNDPRVLPVGRFLRKTKLNELPQLFNIFLGDMSFVGPRPLVAKMFQAYSEDVKNKLYNIRPGLTGVGSIVFRDEESIIGNRVDAVEFHEKVIGGYKGVLEAWYSEQDSLCNYFVIVFITAWVVLFPKSDIFWKLFPHAPKPPGELRSI